MGAPAHCLLPYPPSTSPSLPPHQSLNDISKSLTNYAHLPNPCVVVWLCQDISQLYIQLQGCTREPNCSKILGHEILITIRP
jgi:hypothetical protein